MPSQTVTVASTVGLHARPASLLIKAATAAGVPVTIGRVGQEPVNAASMLNVLALGAKFGDELEVTVADGPNAQEILESLVEIIRTNHDG